MPVFYENCPIVRRKNPQKGFFFSGLIPCGHAIIRALFFVKAEISPILVYLR